VSVVVVFLWFEVEKVMKLSIADEADGIRAAFRLVVV
jgi:hypothetical protein